MDIHKSLSTKPYYNSYHRKFPHYYEVHYTNKDKIDYILIESLQKGFQPKDVLSALDQAWEDCLQREQDYQQVDGEPIDTHQSYFEAYLRNVIRKVLVFEEFQRIFAAV